MGCGCKNKKTIPTIKKPILSKKSIIDLVKTKIYADEKVIIKRNSICLFCEYLRKKDEKINTLKLARCGKCGCFVLSKTKLKTTKCPIGEW